MVGNGKTIPAPARQCAVHPYRSAMYLSAWYSLLCFFLCRLNEPECHQIPVMCAKAMRAIQLDGSLVLSLDFQAYDGDLHLLTECLQVAQGCCADTCAPVSREHKEFVKERKTAAQLQTEAITDN